ncbi:sigma-70 family RNA polymerase sigma factor [Patescibacteria group bacterium]|jgi:RNA polymerase sigma-70 factor (ECF subfamily)|nr:sigma-70 family RNA polymerase sigma factor [Patescibacteria group bacterium]
MDLTNDIRGSVILTDTESRILFASRGVGERTGFDLPETIGRRPSELWGGGMERPFYARMWRLITKGVPFAESVRNHRKNGDGFETPLYIAPLRGEDDVWGYLALQPDEDTAGFREEFFQASAADASPTRLQDLLEGRFGWKTGERAERRSTLFDLLARTLVDPVRERFHARVEDAELVRRAQGNSEAFSSLVAKYHGTVRRYFRHRLSDPERAEDLAQETFERAFRALPGFQMSNASYQTYLLRIAHNLLVSEYRRAAPPIIAEESDRQAWMTRLEAKDEVERAMAELEPGDRETLQLFYGEGFSVRDISRRLTISENAVKLRLSRARRRIGERMRREG